MKKTKDKAKIVIIILAVIAVIAAAGAVYAGMQNKKADKEKEEVSAEPESTDGSSYITYNGKKYKYNSDLRTMLFMGVDKNEVVTVKENTGRSGQSDCLVLLVLDTDKKTTTLLEISRDSMADVKIYGIDGDYMATETAQIATQYAYGDGEKRSCQLTREAVSNLLYDIPIHDYLSLNMSGIVPIVDQIGGVTMTVPEDYTAIDPAFVQGSTITLNGELTEKYIRSRDTSVLGSNEQRMERQTQFVQALLEKVKSTEDGGNSMLRQFWQVGQPYITTDLSLDMLEKIASYDMNPEILKVPGEVQAGEEHDEFYVDDASLQEMIINIFYKEVES